MWWNGVLKDQAIDKLAGLQIWFQKGLWGAGRCHHGPGEKWDYIIICLKKWTYILTSFKVAFGNWIWSVTHPYLLHYVVAYSYMQSYMFLLPCLVLDARMLPFPRTWKIFAGGVSICFVNNIHKQKESNHNCENLALIFIPFHW